MIVYKFHVINSYQQRKNSHSANVQKCCSNAAQILSHFLMRLPKGGTQIFILINQKSAFCMLFHENWSVLGFVQVRAVTQACNLHGVGQFLKPKDATYVNSFRLVHVLLSGFYLDFILIKSG